MLDLHAGKFFFIFNHFMFLSLLPLYVLHIGGGSGYLKSDLPAFC